MAFKNIEAEIDGGGVLRLVEIPQISDGENISVGLRVSADEDFLDGQPSDAIYCFEFMAADGGRYVTPPIVPEQGVIAYEVENSVLRGDGETRAQLVVKSQSGGYIFKSNTAAFEVSPSVNAEFPTYYRRDFLTAAQKLFAEAAEKTEELDAVKDEMTVAAQSVRQLADEMREDIAAGEFDGPQGAKGADGVGIVSIVKTGVSGNVDTYTITLSNGSAQTFTVTNGTNGTDGVDGKTHVFTYSNGILTIA